MSFPPDPVELRGAFFTGREDVEAVRNALREEYWKALGDPTDGGLHPSEFTYEQYLEARLAKNKEHRCYCFPGEPSLLTRAEAAEARLAIAEEERDGSRFLRECAETALRKAETRIEEVERQRDWFYDDYDKAQDRLVKTEDRLAEVEQERDDIRATLTDHAYANWQIAETNRTRAEDAEARVVELERRERNYQRNAAAALNDQEARIEELKGALWDVAYGLRNQPELTREQIAQAAENSAATDQEAPS